ncbi:MAG: response regulator, partial [Syntrophales bacterium]
MNNQAKRILVVEDNEEYRDLLGRLLGTQGYEYDGAQDGVEALEKLRASNFDLIISDVLMPRMDGFQLCHAVKTDERLQSIPVVFYTGYYTDAKDEELLQTIGAALYLIKPMEKDMLLENIRQVLERPGTEKFPAPTRILDGKEFTTAHTHRMTLKLVQQVGEMAMIAKIGRVVGSTLDIHQIYEMVAVETRKLIPYDRFLVNRKETPDGQFTCAYVSGMENPRRKEGDLYSGQGAATGVVMNTRESVLIQPDDAEEIKDLYPNLYETFKTGLRSTMCVPLISMDEVIGTMTFRSKKLKAYTEQDLRLAEKIGMQVAGAIANAQMFDNLQKTEKSLRENEELFSLFIRHSPIYTYIKEVTPTESIVLQASDNFGQMIGIPGCKMIGKTMAELFPSEFGVKITADDWAVVTKGDVLQQDEELNGRSYNTIKFPIIRRDKTLLAGYTIDITERKRMADELLKARNGLEQRVLERTQELENVNKTLTVEIQARTQSETALHESEL